MRAQIVIAGLALTACGGVNPGPSVGLNQVAEPDLPILGEAPELTSEQWLNAEGPLRLSDLRGQVVLLEMWTFGCVNCQRVIPYLNDWYARYSPKGFTIIGNHYPEFEYERDLGRVAEALDRHGIEYPVAQDNRGETWRAYGSRFWPTMFLIDKQGRIRYVHIGEGAYAETEAAIQALLAEPHPQQAGKRGAAISSH